MKPLPDTFIHGSLAFWVPMQPQPHNGHLIKDGSIINYDPRNIKGDRIKPPHALGDTLYEREEWRYVSRGQYFDTIEFRDGMDFRVPSGVDDIDSTPWHEWQPSSTLPSWAARQRYTVATVEGKQVKDLNGGAQERMAFGILLSGTVDNDWGWYIVLQPEEEK